MVDMAPRLPQALEERTGPHDPEQLEGAVASLGPRGVASAALLAQGLVPPDVLCGQTLFLLARQPRSAGDDAARRASPIAGGVWVREQFTIHRPVPIDEPFVVRGASVRRFVRKGRRYGVTTSATYGAGGELLVSNCTTGLLEYAADPSRGDAEDGLAESAVAVPGPDDEQAGANTCSDMLSRARGDEVHERDPFTLELAWMVRRDGRRPMNPIHSDPEQARKAGLRAPIAGGSHVAAFALELAMQAWGATCLLHGAHLDLRWFAPTEGGDVIIPRVEVAEAASAGGRLVAAVGVDAVVDGARVRRVQGTVTIPVSPTG